MKNLETTKTCFVISPIGEPGSLVRKHADQVFKFIIEPALKTCQIRPIRSDQMNEPGKISEQMFRAIFERDLCIAVLTGANPNVYYELAVAQSAIRPVIILIEEGQPLPFDIQDFRVLRYELGLESYDARTHIVRLEAFVKSIEQEGWKGTDVFFPYRKGGLESNTPDAKTFGVRIRYPMSGATVDAVDVEGSFERLPPLGYELRSLRYYPSQHGFIPHGSIAVDRASKTWKVARFDVGGQSGDCRGIEIAAAGPEAKLLLDYWTDAHEVHREVMKVIRDLTGGYGNSRWLPPIKAWPRDLLTCARVEVIRK
jgi:hypothetical protein